MRWRKGERKGTICEVWKIMRGRSGKFCVMKRFGLVIKEAFRCISIQNNNPYRVISSEAGLQVSVKLKIRSAGARG